MIITRFAPSPTGLLHLGHAFAALFAFRAAKPSGRFLLRIEDIDRQRCRPEYEKNMLQDLSWLGLHWESPVLRQSENLHRYDDALKKLGKLGLIYPCFCTRSDITREIAKAPIAPHAPKKNLYPGTCRHLPDSEREERIDQGENHALRLDIDKAQSLVGKNLKFEDKTHGVIISRPGQFGDIVLARKDVATSYHLSATIDDAFQGVTLVTRGEDLLSATSIHRLLQELLGLPVPHYQHHKLIIDETGERLAKRKGAESLQSMRHAGKTHKDVLTALENISNTN